MSDQKHNHGENFSTQVELLRRYCAFQERSVSDVLQKARKIQLNSADTERAVSILKEEGFLDEHRFAQAFVNGKLRYNHWGRIKIRYELQLRRVDKAIIETVLNSVDEIYYLSILTETVRKKAIVLQKNQQTEIFQKLVQYAMNKGFESELIRKVLKENKLT